jgi:hypothetical protein
MGVAAVLRHLQQPELFDPSHTLSLAPSLTLSPSSLSPSKNDCFAACVSHPHVCKWREGKLIANSFVNKLFVSLTYRASLFGVEGGKSYPEEQTSGAISWQENM